MIQDAPCLSADLQDELFSISAECVAIHQLVEALKGESAKLQARCINVSTRCGEFVERVVSEHPKAAPILAPLMDAMRAEIAKLTGSLQ